jgi:hypothetical protein
MQAPTVTWPGGIGNPAGEKIVTSGGRRRSTRRNRKNRKQTRKNRKQTRKNRSCRRNRAGCTRRNRRS